MVQESNMKLSKRKEQLMADSPMLRIFIDNYAKSDPEMWKKMLDRIFVAKKEEMINLLGEKLIEHDIRSFLWMEGQSKIFNPDVEEESVTALIFCFACMGYEIGPDNNMDQFLDDILENLRVFNVVRQVDESRQFIYRVMNGGVKWKNNIGADTPMAFKNFINKLDF